MRWAAGLIVAAAFALGSSCSPTAEPVADGGQADVLASRETLANPMSDLADAVLDLSSGVDEARHKVARGDDMAAALRQLEERRQGVVNAASKLGKAADDVPVRKARDIAVTAADDAQTTAEDATSELEFLDDLVTIDRALFDAAATWDEPGSQSEIRERLDALADDVATLGKKARALQPQPERCDAMRRNRLDWIRTVRQRTERLQGQANSAGGREFDQLRASYRALPFAVEPRTADRADRDCWVERSGVARGEKSLRASVEELRAALSG